MICAVLLLASVITQDLVPLVDMKNGGISAILFDLDNTLVDTAGAGQLALLRVCELLRSKLKDANTSEICKLFACKLYEEQFDPSAGLTIDDVRINHWHEALREAENMDPGRALASDCYYTWKTTRLQALALTPEVFALLQELKRSYKLLLLTNGEAQTQREKLEVVRYEGLFSAVVVAGEHAEQKPAVSIFTHCFELLGVKPQDCIMVGDSLDTDILGGFNAGVRATVWISKKPDALPENCVTPNYTIPSVLELPGVLAKLK